MSAVMGDKAEFKVSLDMKQFTPEDFKVTTVDNYLVIEGSHKDKDESGGGGFIERQFLRKYLLPEGVNVDEIECELGPDGTLLIHAPKLPLGTPSRKKEVPIKNIEMPAGSMQQQQVPSQQGSTSRNVPVSRHFRQQQQQQQVAQPPREVSGQFEVKLPPGTVEKMIGGQQQRQPVSSGRPQEGKPEHHVTFADVHAGPHVEHRVAQQEAQIRAEVEHHVAQQEAQILAEAEHHVAQQEAQIRAEAEHHVAQQEAQILAEVEHNVAQQEARLRAEAEHKVAQQEAQIRAEAEHQVAQQEAQIRAEVKHNVAQQEAQIRAEAEHHVAIAEQQARIRAEAEHHVARAEQHVALAEQHVARAEQHVGIVEHIGVAEHPVPRLEHHVQRAQIQHAPITKAHVPRADAAGVEHHRELPEFNVPQHEVHHVPRGEIHHLPKAEQVAPEEDFKKTLLEHRAKLHHVPPPAMHHFAQPEQHAPFAEVRLQSVAKPEHHMAQVEAEGVHHGLEAEHQVPRAEAGLQHIPLTETQGPSLMQPSLTVQVHGPIAEKHVGIAEQHLAAAEHHLAVAEKHVEPILQEQLQVGAPSFVPLPQQEASTPSFLQPIPEFHGPRTEHVLPIPPHAPMTEHHLPSPFESKHMPASMDIRMPMEEQHVPSKESRIPLPTHHMARMEAHMAHAEPSLSERLADLGIQEEGEPESVQDILARKGGIGTEEFQPVEHGTDVFPGMDMGRQYTKPGVESEQQPSAPSMEEDKPSSRVIQSTGASSGTMPLGGSGLSQMPLGGTGLGSHAPLEEARTPLPSEPSGGQMPSDEGIGEDLSTSRAIGQEKIPTSGGVGYDQEIPSSGGIGHHQEIPSLGAQTGMAQHEMEMESPGEISSSEEIAGHQGLSPSAPQQIEPPVAGLDIRQNRPPMSGMAVTPVQPGAPQGMPTGGISSPGQESRASAPVPMEPTMIVKMQPSGMSATLLPPTGPTTGKMEVGDVSMDIGTETAHPSGSQLEQRQAEVGGERAI